MSATSNSAPNLAAVRELADLKAAQKWGREHPFAGVCGEDDARADRIAELESMGVTAPQDSRKSAPKWNRP